MPIIGIVPGAPSECRLDRMKVGESGYTNVVYFSLTENNFLFLDLFAVVNIDESDIEDYGYFVSVKRIGTGVTADDFELDFRLTYPIVINDLSVYRECMNEPAKFIIYADAPVEVIPTKEELPSDEDKLEELKIELKQFEDAEEWLKVGEITKAINELEIKIALKNKNEEQS